eukprot:scaffold2657_cov155-Skeletonema_marinoi.AAC.5
MTYFVERGSKPAQSSPEGNPIGFQLKSDKSSHDESDNHGILNCIFPEDGRLVGTDAIFTSSPNVTPQFSSDAESNTHKRLDIPTPSIYTDERGEIHNIKANDKRINILYTKNGYLRSGDLHPNEQCDFIFSGKVKIWTLQSDGSTKITDYCAHDFISIPRGVPHVFEFVEDTVMAEWWEPPGFQAWFYKPYRDIVNKKIMGEGGGNGRRKGLEILVNAGEKSRWSTVKLALGAVFVGSLGFALGRRSR